MRKTIVTACLVLVAGAGTAFAGRPIQLKEAMQLASRPGSWIEADGDVLPDGSFQGKDFEVYSPGDTLQCDTPAIYGKLTDLNRTKSTLRCLGYFVTWDANTTIKDENKRKILSSKLEEGMGIKIQGTLQPNGSFMASKIKIYSRGTEKAKEKVFGPVTILDPETGKMRILNTVITVKPNGTFVETPPTLQ